MLSRFTALSGLLCIATACSTPAAHQAHPGTVIPADVFLLRSYGDHRVVIVRLCNPAHCYTRGFLETMSKNEPREVIATTPIEELEHHWWSFVQDVIPPEYPDNYFDIVAEDTHGTDAGFTMRLYPSPDGSYRSEMLEFRSGADP